MRHSKCVQLYVYIHLKSYIIFPSQHTFAYLPTLMFLQQLRQLIHIFAI